MMQVVVSDGAEGDESHHRVAEFATPDLGFQDRLGQVHPPPHAQALHQFWPFSLGDLFIAGAMAPSTVLAC